VNKINDAKPYESFLFFVSFTLVITFVPLFRALITELYLQITFTLIIVFIVTLVIKKVAITFGNFCLRFKIKLLYLYLLYIVLYFIVFLFFD
jgi:hypothetical protein